MIVITSSQNIALDLEQRRALRQFVDKGGTLWIDTVPGAGAIDASMIFHTQFSHNTAGALGATSANDLSHPLATGYYTLSSSDLDSLGSGFNSGRQIVSAFSGNSPDPSLFHAVNTLATGATGSNFGSIAAANYGNGHILITDRAICGAINNGVGSNLPTPNFNQGGFCGTNFLAAPTADLKFAVNVLAWASNTSGPSGGERGTNAQLGASNGALQSNWTFPLQPPSPATPIAFSPIGTATYGNRVYVTSGDGYLRAFDINPSESLAYGKDLATTNGDDYVNVKASDPVTNVPYSADYSAGYPYDEIWAQPVDTNNAVSAPVVAEIPIAPVGGGAAVNTPEVLVENASGIVYASNAVSGATDYVAGGDNNLKFAANAPIPAPVYYRGRIFATQADGKVQVSTPGTGVVPFNTAVETAAGASLSSPFVQSIPGSDMKNYNGDDVVAYIYDVSGSSTSNIYALFLGSRDEHEQYLAFNGPVAGGAGTSTYQTIQQTLPNLPGLTVTGAPEDTDNLTPGENQWLFDFPNTLPPSENIAVPQAQSNTGAVVTNTVQNANVPSADIYGDYDLSPNMMQPNMIRSMVNTDLMASVTQTSQIQGMAVSSVSQGIAASLSNVSTAFNTANNFYVTVNEPSKNTAYIMAVKERSPSVAQSFIPWRFALVSGVTDAEGVTYNFAGYQFYGPPVSDGNGYVYALATNPTTNTTIVMAFFANAICGFIAPFTATTVTQLDELQQSETILNSQYANNTFSNFTTLTTSPLQPNLAAPLPLTITGAGTNGGPPESEQVAMSTAQGAQPLLVWWVQLPVGLTPGVAGTTPSVAPISPLRKIGNTLYFEGQESTPVATGTPPVNNALFAIYADPIGIGIQPDPVTRQINSSDYRLVQVTPMTFGPTVPVSSLATPYQAPAPSAFGRYVITAAPAYTVSGGTATPGGIEGLGYTPTLVTDNHRLVEMDPSGNATLVIDSTREPTTQQIAGTGPYTIANPPAPTVPNPIPTASLRTIVPLNRPTSLTQFSSDDYLLADTGNNRVIHIGRNGDVLTEFPDKYGHTLMSMVPAVTTVSGVITTPPILHTLEITGFSDPAGILAPGAPLTLNQPSNVTFWTTYDVDPSVFGNVPNKITTHYLICDSGNDRIVEVDDTYTQDQATVYGGATSTTYDFAQDQDYHQLVWVTKTTENGHRYKYVAAQALFPSSSTYTPLTSGPEAILAAVSNARVANLTVTATAPPTLAPANQDSQGSAVLAFSYIPVSGATGNPYTANAANAAVDGLPFVVINSVQADGKTTTGPQPTTPIVSYALRGLRSVQAYLYNAPSNAAPNTTQLGLVIADDDGVFDGLYNAASTTVGPGTLDATTVTGGWSFRVDPQTSVAEDDYTPIVTQYDALLDVKDNQPLIGGNAATDYAGTSFSPASALRLANNSYLIVNRGGSGNPNGVPQFPATGETETDFGGNVFVVHANPPVSGSTAVRGNGGTLAGVIFGKPANTSALDGPSFALKSN